MENVFKNITEITYTYPLPGRALITNFSFKIDDRIVTSVLKEKEEAKRTYEEELDTGRKAVLSRQENLEIFTTILGNIQPGDTISFLGELGRNDNEPTWRLPTTIGEQYTPGKPLGASLGEGTTFDTDRVKDASRATPPLADVPIKISLEATFWPDVEVNANFKHDYKNATLIVKKTKPNKDLLLRIPNRKTRT